MSEDDKPLIWLHGEVRTPPLSSKARVEAGSDWLPTTRSCDPGDLAMHESKQAKLKAAGWKIGDAQDFLGLTPEETAYIDLRLRLGDAVRERRKEKSLTQNQLANLMGSSQSRVAKAEAADDSVSLDLLIRSLLALGASNRDLARYISEKK